MDEKNQEQMWDKLRYFQVYMQISTILVVLWLWLTGINILVAEVVRGFYYIVFGIVVFIWNFAFFYTPSGLHAKKKKKKLQKCLFGMAFLEILISLYFLVLFMHNIIGTHLLSWLIALIVWVIFLPLTLSVIFLSESQIPLSKKKKWLVVYNFAINLILSIYSILILIYTGGQGGIPYDFDIIILYLGLMASYFFILTAMILIHYTKSYQK